MLNFPTKIRGFRSRAASVREDGGCFKKVIRFINIYNFLNNSLSFTATEVATSFYTYLQNSLLRCEAMGNMLINSFITSAFVEKRGLF